MEKFMLYGQNLCLSKATLAAAGGNNTFGTTGILTYVINGKFYTLAAQVAAATPVVDAVTGKPITLTKQNGCVVVWCVDAAGAVKVVVTPIVPNLTGADSVSLDAGAGAAGKFVPTPPQFGPIPDTLCPFAYTVIKGDPNVVGVWTFGVSNWNAAGITLVHQDICMLPDRPQVN